MKNQREIMEAALAGKKLRCNFWDKDAYVYLNSKDCIVTHKGQEGSFDLATRDVSDWEIFQEPKTMKLEAWIVDGGLFHFREGEEMHHTVELIRVPSEDKTITLEQE